MMTINIPQLIGAVTREVSTREKNGAPTRVVVATRNYDTSVEDLWDAITNSERIPRWFLPITGDFRVGGSYQLQGHAGGEIVECEPPRRLGLTWGMNGEVSWVNVELSETLDGAAHLRLEHVADVPEEFWAQYGPGAVGVGWDSALFGLGEHISTRASVSPEDAASWLSSPEGRLFVGQSSDAWCAAAIAAGFDPVAAREAASRTIAAYTGDQVEAKEG